MRALAIRAYGGPDQLAVLDLPRPTVQDPHDVVVAIRAGALNHLDLFVLEGLPGVRHTFPHVVGCDAAGVVDAIGAGVTRVRVGDRVIINAGLHCGRCEWCERGEQSLCQGYGVRGEHAPGLFADAVRIGEDKLATVPDTIGWHEAAAFSLVTLTAWRMLVTRAAVRPGETVLVWGIGGGVALAALQVAKLRGARAIVTSSDDGKLQRAAAMGADATVNHRSGDVVKAVREFAGGRGVDVVVDTVGEATWETSTRCLARGGRLVTCGGTRGHRVTTDVRKLFWHQWTVLGSTTGNHREFAEVAHLLAQGSLRGVVDRVYPLAEARAAFERLAAGGQFGKIVLDLEA